MTVRKKMDQIIQNDPDFKDCGIHHIDGRSHGVLQNMSNGKIKVIYESKDDIDDDGNPCIVESDYDSLKDLFEDYKLIEE
jgi:hypothetical protein